MFWYIYSKDITVSVFAYPSCTLRKTGSLNYKNTYGSNPISSFGVVGHNVFHGIVGWTPTTGLDHLRTVITQFPYKQLIQVPEIPQTSSQKLFLLQWCSSFLCGHLCKSPALHRLHYNVCCVVAEWTMKFDAFPTTSNLLFMLQFA